MRDIRFKAKNLCGHWVEGDLCHQLTGGIAILGYKKKENDIGLFSGCQTIDPTTVCQFTGLRDIEGNSIFENDLLTKDGTVVYKVGYVNCGFAASYEDEDDFSLNLLAISKYCRICGNEFDRKEGECQH